jgi:hypothetical protein
VDDANEIGTTCTVRQDAFARVWAETGNQAAAYRTAYNVHERTLPNTVWNNASRIAAIPCVRKQADEYRQKAALEMIVTVREALQWQVDIATADPNEIYYVAQRCCRNCYGINFKKQWVDYEEYSGECIKALDEGRVPPSDEGGYGYSRAREPALECPHCLGAGIPENVVNDTRKLQGKARKLFKGIDIKNGQLVVQIHDQQKAWEMACRMLGAFNDKLDLRTPAERGNLAKIPEGSTEQDAARAYVSLMG